MPGKQSRKSAVKTTERLDIVIDVHEMMGARAECTELLSCHLVELAPCYR
jgi:hypothetical protein